MPVPDNFKGKKGRSGRKKKADEIMQYIEKIKEEVTQDALIKLANSKVFEYLNGANSFRQVKELGLPITLKGMTEKIEADMKLNNTLSDEQKEELAKRILKRRG